MSAACKCDFSSVRRPRRFDVAEAAAIDDLREAANLQAEITAAAPRAMERRSDLALLYAELSWLQARIAAAPNTSADERPARLRDARADCQRSASIRRELEAAYESQPTLAQNLDELTRATARCEAILQTR